MKNISKKIIILLCFSLILTGLLTPVSFNYAADPNTIYTPLAPLPGTPTGGFDIAKTSSLGTYINIIINLVIGISAVLAVVMTVIGGIEYMTSELPGGKEGGKDRIKDALLGLLIALGAYALLNTINSDLLNSNINISAVTVTVALTDLVPQTYDPVTKKYSNGITYGTPLTGTIPPKCTTNTQTGCLPLFVTLNNPECATVGQQNCTSTIGLNMSQVRTIQWGCGCPLVVTGGTEWWLHGGSSGSTLHQPGQTTVDLRPNQQLNTYLAGSQTLVAGKWYPSPIGQVLYEVHNGVPHWHVGG
jgi:hypothetical protein